MSNSCSVCDKLCHWVMEDDVIRLTSECAFKLKYHSKNWRVLHYLVLRGWSLFHSDSVEDGSLCLRLLLRQHQGYRVRLRLLPVGTVSWPSLPPTGKHWIGWIESNSVVLYSCCSCTRSNGEGSDCVYYRPVSRTNERQTFIQNTHQ